MADDQLWERVACVDRSRSERTLKLGRIRNGVSVLVPAAMLILNRQQLVRLRATLDSLLEDLDEDRNA